MKTAKIIAPFTLSGVLFILSYLSSRDDKSGLFPLMLMGIGVIIAMVGSAALFSDKRRE